MLKLHAQHHANGGSLFDGFCGMYQSSSSSSAASSEVKSSQPKRSLVLSFPVIIGGSSPYLSCARLGRVCVGQGICEGGDVVILY